MKKKIALYIREIGLVIKKSYQKEIPGPDGFTDEFCQTSKS